MLLQPLNQPWSERHSSCQYASDWFSMTGSKVGTSYDHVELIRRINHF